MSREVPPYIAIPLMIALMVAAFYFVDNAGMAITISIQPLLVIGLYVYKISNQPYQKT